MNTHTLLQTASAAFAAGLASTASAQLATSLVETGQTLTVNGNVTTIDALAQFNVNGLGGYAVLADDDNEEFILGSVGALAPGLLAREGSLGGFVIDDFANAPDIANDGTVAFRAGTTGVESVVFRGGVAVAVRGDAVPTSTGITGADFRIPNRVQISADGTGTSFTSSLDGVGTASALFTDDGGSAPLQFFFSPSGGNQSTVVSGTALQANLGNSSYEVSSSGDRFIAEVDTGGVGTTDGAIAVGTVGGSVAVPVFAGSTLREFNPISADATERWDEFDRFGIADDGTILFTGNLQDDDGVNVAEYLALDDAIRLRTGDLIGGAAIDGDFATAEVNNTGDYATIVSIGGNDTLVVNGEALLTASVDAVAVDAGVETLTGFSEGVDRLGISDAVNGVFSVYFQGSTASTGSGLFVAVVPEPASLALLAAGGALLTRRRRA